MKKKIQYAVLSPAGMLILGLFTGFAVKEIDIHFYAQHWGISLSNVFSEAGIWIVIGVAISLYSRNKRYAMLNVFFYCVGMLITYYLTAELTDSVYSWAYIRLWIVFACFSPVMAYLVALTRRRGVLSLVLKVGIFAGYIGLNLLLGVFLKGYDILFFLLLIYLLFIRDRKNAAAPDRYCKERLTKKGEK